MYFKLEEEKRNRLLKDWVNECTMYLMKATEALDNLRKTAYDPAGEQSSEAVHIQTQRTR